MIPRFLSSLFKMVPFFLLFGCHKETLKQKGQKGTTQEPGNLNLKTIALLFGYPKVQKGTTEDTEVRSL